MRRGCLQTEIAKNIDFYIPFNKTLKKAKLKLLTQNFFGQFKHQKINFNMKKHGILMVLIIYIV